MDIKFSSIFWDTLENEVKHWQNLTFNSMNSKTSRDETWATHIVSGSIGLDWVFRSQGYTAHGNDHQDTHLKVAETHDVMAQTPHPAQKTLTMRERLKAIYMMKSDT